MEYLRKLATVLMVGLGSMLLPGCFDLTEVDDINIVTALGVDQTNNGFGASNGTIGQSGQRARRRAEVRQVVERPTVQAFIVRVETGNSIEEAVEKFNQEVPHHIVPGAQSLIVFGNAYAKHGIDTGYRLLWNGSRYFRRTELFVVTSGTA